MHSGSFVYANNSEKETFRFLRYRLLENGIKYNINRVHVDIQGESKQLLLLLQFVYIIIIYYTLYIYNLVDRVGFIG